MHAPVIPADQNPRAIHDSRIEILDAEPSWLDEGAAGFGAPEFLWHLLMDRYGAYSAAQLGRVLARPAALRRALVATWREWREAWIESEWSEWGATGTA